MLTLSLKIEMPDELLRQCLQHIRDFDVKHFDHVIIAMWCDAPAMSKERMKAILASINPPFAKAFEIGFGEKSCGPGHG